MPRFARNIASPVGELRLVASQDGLAGVLWTDDRPGRVRLGELIETPDHPILRETERQLGEYFAGRRKVFDLPLDMTGTDFQRIGLDRTSDDPLRRNPQLSRYRPTGRQDERLPRRRRRQRPEPHLHHHPLPPRHRRQRLADRLRRRDGGKGLSLAAGKRAEGFALRRKACSGKGLEGHSHSIVPGGLLVTS